MLSNGFEAVPKQLQLTNQLNTISKARIACPIHSSAIGCPVHALEKTHAINCQMLLVNMRSNLEIPNRKTSRSILSCTYEACTFGDDADIAPKTNVCM